MNDTEREQWVQNDQALYNWWRGSRLSMRKFLRKYRVQLDNFIVEQLNRGPERTGSYHNDITLQSELGRYQPIPFRLWRKRRP